MVYNTFKAINYLNLIDKINENNIRKIWDILIDDVCENERVKGVLYKDGFVKVGGFIPTELKYISYGMNQVFEYENQSIFFRKHC